MFVTWYLLLKCNEMSGYLCLMALYNCGDPLPWWGEGRLPDSQVARKFSVPLSGKSLFRSKIGEG